MSWYSAGSVAVTNGSATIIGTGTSWVRNVRVGDAFKGPDKAIYEVGEIVSDTEITLAAAYDGATTSGAAYRVVPTTSHDKELVNGITTILATSGRQVAFYASRADFESAQPDIAPKIGALASADETLFEYDGVSSLLPNLPGWKITKGRQYKTDSALMASQEASRGLGSVWEAGGFRYEQVASGETHTTAAGVKLRLLQGGAFDRANHIGQQPISSVTDLETRLAGVESVASSGMSPKAAAVCATTANITLSGEQTIDGVQTAASRVLVKNQTTASQNGIYVSGSGAWARASDMNAADEVQGTAVYVTGGTVGAGKTFYTGSEVTTLGTDPIAWLVTKDQAALAAEVAGKLDPKDAVLPPTMAGMVDYSGNGPIYPLALDQENRALIWYDVNADRVYTAGDEQTTEQVAENVAIAGTPVSGAKQAHFWYGQSNATGAGAGSVITTSQPYNNVMFNGGAQPGTTQSYAETTASLYTSFSALVEATYETPVSGCANYTRTFAARRGEAPGAVSILGAGLAHGGYEIAALKKGSAWYTSPYQSALAAMGSIDSAFELAIVHYVQGETEQINGTVTAAAYQAELEQLQADMEADAQAATGQTASVYMLAAQISDIFDGGTPYSEISKAILAAAQASDKIFLTVPLYYLSYGSSDNLHLSAEGKKQLAGYHARAADRIAQGFQPRWLNPLGAWSEANVVYVKFDVPVQPLVFDTSRLGAVTDYGFAVEDAGGIMTITEIAAYGDTVKITLSATPSGATEVRCAIDYAGGGLPAASNRTGVSNLRDSSPETVTIDGSTFNLYNPAPHFALDVHAISEM